MQKQAKIDFSNPHIKRILWNLKHFNREYKVAYNISILIISTNLILLGGITWGSINFSLGVSCRYDPFAWIFFGGICVVFLLSFWVGCSAQKILKKSGYDGHYDPVLSEFAKLRTRAFLFAVIELIGMLAWGMYSAFINYFSYIAYGIESFVAFFLFFLQPGSLLSSIKRIKNQLVLEALASDSENAPTEQLEETERPQSQAENPQAEAPQPAQSNFCTVCGNRITDPEALFCERCGRRLK